MHLMKSRSYSKYTISFEQDVILNKFRNSDTLVSTKSFDQDAIPHSSRTTSGSNTGDKSYSISDNDNEQFIVATAATKPTTNGLQYLTARQQGMKE